MPASTEELPPKTNRLVWCWGVSVVVEVLKSVVEVKIPASSMAMAMGCDRSQIKGAPVKVCGRVVLQSTRGPGSEDRQKSEVRKEAAVALSHASGQTR